jgi:hypothetical protein
MNIEQWRLISGYDNYEISSHGRVRNNKTNGIMKSKIESNGYARITLRYEKSKRTHRVHILVADAFLNKNIEHTDVDHKDHNRSNNMLNNLRWVTHSQNCRNKSRQHNNTSGTPGVYFHKNGYWIASWNNDIGCKTKSFSIKKYGDEEAKQLAINYRKERAQENGYLNI